MLRSHRNCQSHDPTGIDWNLWNRTSLSPSEPWTKSVTQTANGDRREVKGEKSKEIDSWIEKWGEKLEFWIWERTASDFDISCKCSKCILQKLFVLILHHWVTLCYMFLHGETGQLHMVQNWKGALHAAFTDRAILYDHYRNQNELVSRRIAIWNLKLLLKKKDVYYSLSGKNWRWCCCYWYSALPLVIVVSRGSSLWPDVMGRQYFPFIIHTRNRNCRN